MGLMTAEDAGTGKPATTTVTGREPAGIGRGGDWFMAGPATITPSTDTGQATVDGCTETVNAERSWQYMVFCRERTGWFHWKVRKLYTADIIRLVVKLKKTSRSPGGIFGKDWPQTAYVKFAGPSTKEITLYKKDDWFYGSPRKYHSEDFPLNAFKPGTYKLYVKADPDGYIETDAQLQVELTSDERPSGAEALAIGGLIGGSVLVIVLIIILGFFMISHGL